MKLNKKHLDLASTVVGIAIAMITALGTQKIIDAKTAGFVGSLLVAVQGWLIQRPADTSPDTEDVENARQQLGS